MYCISSIDCTIIAAADLETVDTLDIAFQNFSLVGGEKAFLDACGGGRQTDDNDRGLLQMEKIVNVCKYMVFFHI